MPGRPFIYLATPCFGGLVNLHFMQSVLRLQEACEQRGVGLHVELLANDALITRARSRLAASFLAHPEASHLLFIDADIGFEPKTVFRLLDSGHDVVAAVCPLKHIDWDKLRAAAKADVADLQAASIGYVVRFLPTADSSVEVHDGIAKVAYGGTGVLMISRSALTRIAEAHPELNAVLEDGSRAVMVFDTLLEEATGEYLSEDYAFCRRWRDLGGDIWADIEARLTHVGHAAYTGSLIQALRRG
ncbi:hypothetical protein [Phenylobacterium sp. J367]|uniref:hypothetical protein n=1 Tax=Phenylobacterium sp. J367 TaxID=2898435 RepID=UPI0021509145|nr:hypothetical protein [Phenylobacterium sp. J367]MCR5878162.1 hypothetical protein [Phenylobacterium sp. J367]